MPVHLLIEGIVIGFVVAVPVGLFLGIRCRYRGRAGGGNRGSRNFTDLDFFVGSPDATPLGRRSNPLLSGVQDLQNQPERGVVAGEQY